MLPQTTAAMGRPIRINTIIPTIEAMIASFFNRYPGANNPGMYLAAYWPILSQMKQRIDQADGNRNSLSKEENERLQERISRKEKVIADTFQDSIPVLRSPHHMVLAVPYHV